MRQLLFAALAAVGLTLAAAPSAPAQYVQYYSPYTYGSTAYYTYPNTGYMYNYPYGYTTNYVGPTVYGPGWTTSNYPYMYNQMNYYSYPYTAYYSPGYTTTRYYRWWQ